MTRRRQPERHYGERIGWLRAAMPLAIAGLSPQSSTIPLVAGGSLVFLALLGGIAARVGGANSVVGAARVTFWGALAMALTAAIGAAFGTVV